MATVGAAALAPNLAAAQAAAPATVGGAEQPLTVGIQAVTTYDSNPARGSALNAELRGIRSDDVTVSPSLTVAYSHTSGIQGLAVSGNFGYDHYIKNDSLSREHLDFSAATVRTVGALCSVSANARYNRGQADLAYLTVEVTKNTLQTYDVSFSETCGTPTGLTESVQVARGATQNSNPGLVGFTTTNLSGLIGYSNSTVGVAGLTLSYNRTDYDDVPTTSNVRPDLLEVTGIGVQVTRPIGARLSGSAAVSYSHSSESFRSGAPLSAGTSFSGVTASAGLIYTVGSRLHLSAHAARDVSGAMLQDVGYAVVTRADLAADYTLSSRISASVGGSWSQNTYHGLNQVVLTTTPQRQEMISAYGRISVQIGRRSSISFDVRHDVGQSDLALYKYTNNRASLTLSTSL